MSELIQKAHAEFSPSSFTRLMECPVSFYITRLAALSGGDTKESTEGTVAHEVVEELSKREFKLPSDWVPDPKLITPDMLRHSQEYVEYMKQKMKECGMSSPEITLEERVYLDLERECFGTADFVAVQKVEEGVVDILIGDLKYGVGVYVGHPGKSWQLIAYALAKAEGLKKSGVKVRNYNLTYYQPRHASFKGEHHTYQQEHMDVFKAEIFAKIDLVMSWFRGEPIDLEQYQVVGEHCQFCPVNKNNLCLKRAEKVFEVIKFIEMCRDVGMTDKDIQTMEKVKGIVTPALLRYLTLNRTLIKNVAENMGKATESKIKAGDTKLAEELKLKVIKTSDKLEWIDDTEKVVEVLKKAGVDTPRYEETTVKLISRSAVHKKIGKSKKVLETLAEIEQITGINTKLVDDADNTQALEFAKDGGFDIDTLSQAI